MSYVDSGCTEKTCLSHMYDTSACNQQLDVEQLDTYKVSSVDSYYSKLKLYFWLRLKLQVKT